MEPTPTQDDLLASVRDCIDQRGLLSPRDKVVVAVSGGVDSVALLSVLVALSGEPARAYSLIVAHLDHRLRPDSPQDADFVQQLASRRGLQCVSVSRDIASEAARMGMGIEQAARAIRYEFLLRVAAEHGATQIALGHHADDNIETIVHRIFRGTALRGLCGIPIDRPLEGGTDQKAGDTAAIRLIRPMLYCRRAQIESYCRRQGLTWRTDSTNAESTYRRNFIRNELLPLIRRELSPAADEAILRLAATAGQVDDYLIQQAAALLDQARTAQATSPGERQQAVELDAAKLRQAHAAVVAYAMRLALEHAGVPLREIGGEDIQRLASLATGQADGAVCLGGGFEGRRCGMIFRIDKRQPAETVQPPAEPVRLAVPGETVVQQAPPDAGSLRITCQEAPLDLPAFGSHMESKRRGERTMPANTCSEYLDADKLSGQLSCRPRRDGDVFTPLGCRGRQSVSDFLTNLKLPDDARRRVLCICDDHGIVYLAPLRIDDRVKVDTSTRKTLRITVEHS